MDGGVSKPLRLQRCTEFANKVHGMSHRLVLASASPRRRELLASLGVEFAVLPATIDEFPRPQEALEVYVRRTAREKALTVTRQAPGAFVLACDTDVGLDGVILGKPIHRARAVAMLQHLAGREHRVCTGVCLARDQKILEEFTVESRVTFKPLSDEVIQAYVATGEPLDKAGAYGAQGVGRTLIEKIEGSLTNVIGLPLDEVAALLRRHGLLQTPPASVLVE